MSERSPWREPMVWLMAGLPASSVIAGIALVIIAVRSGGADTVKDDVRGIAQMQLTELSADARAKSMKLSAVLRLEETMVEVLPISGQFMRHQPIMVTLSHPTDATQDRRLVLPPSKLGWRVADNIRANHDWIVQLAPADGEWRIHGRFKAGQKAVYLQSALVGD